MLHQVEEERQVVLPHPLLVEGEDVGAGGGVQEEVGILDALGNALVGEQSSDLVGGQEGDQRLVGYLGVDGHGSRARGWPISRVGAGGLTNGKGRRRGAPLHNPGSWQTAYSAASLRSSRGSGKDMSSTTVETVSTVTA